jgi:hypothetical protein
MSDHEDFGVIRRVLARPPPPGIVGPGAPVRPEHVAAKNPGADASKASFHKVIVNARGPALAAVHFAEPPSGVHPLMQLQTPRAEGVFLILPWAGTHFTPLSNRS